MFKNSPCNSENMSLIPGQEVKIPHATEKLNLYVTTTKPAHYGVELEKPVCHNEDPAQPKKNLFFNFEKRVIHCGNGMRWMLPTLSPWTISQPTEPTFLVVLMLLVLPGRCFCHSSSYICIYQFVFMLDLLLLPEVTVSSWAGSYL